MRKIDYNYCKFINGKIRITLFIAPSLLENSTLANSKPNQKITQKALSLIIFSIFFLYLRVVPLHVVPFLHLPHHHHHLYSFPPLEHFYLLFEHFLTLSLKTFEKKNIRNKKKTITKKPFSMFLPFELVFNQIVPL